MSRFKIGQRVVCVDDSGFVMKSIKQGEEYVINGFNCCAKCGINTVFLIGLNEDIYSQCDCGDVAEERENYRESRFAPLSELTDAISELMKETNLITN